MSKVIITSNVSKTKPEAFDFTDVSNGYFFVLTESPFDIFWNEFKKLCKSNFVKPHIVFLTPLVKEPDHIKVFLLAYTDMIGHVPDDVVAYL